MSNKREGVSERNKVRKISRAEVHAKYNGCCAYCGKKLELKEMQVDHLWPKALETYKVCEGIDVHCNNNMMPSCRRCNHYKRANTLEDFREMLITIHKRLANIYIFNVAIDYGIVDVKPFDGKFYFESFIKT